MQLKPPHGVVKRLGFQGIKGAKTYRYILGGIAMASCSSKTRAGDSWYGKVRGQAEIVFGLVKHLGRQEALLGEDSENIRPATGASSPEQEAQFDFHIEPV